MFLKTVNRNNKTQILLNICYTASQKQLVIKQHRLEKKKKEKNHRTTRSWFSWFAIITIYKVLSKVELVNMGPLLLGKMGLGS